LFWTASYILLTFEHAHCLHIWTCALLALNLFNCWLHCTCFPTALALVLTDHPHCPSDLVTLPLFNCYQTSWGQLLVEPLIFFNHLSCCCLFKPVNNIECKNAIQRKEP
jgi:hypothetical protein